LSHGLAPDSNGEESSVTEPVRQRLIEGFLSCGPIGLLIDGNLVPAESGRTFESINPATGDSLALIADGGPADIDNAVRSARAAFEGEWSRWKPHDRQRALTRLADLFEAHVDELGLLDTLDMGAPWARTRNPARPLGLLHWYAAQAVALHGETIPNSLAGDFFSYTVKEPIGVVAGIIPWNAPIPGALWKIGPVLATGCTLVLKPAEDASLTAIRLGMLCLEAGIPPGVINVVPGGGATAGHALVTHPGIDKIAFTGSLETGRRIIAASATNVTRLTLELGGKSPDIVFADSDLDQAVPGAAMAIFGNSGQVCSAGSRLFVQRAIYDEFVTRVAEFGANLRIGNGIDPDTQLGPLVSQLQLDQVLAYIDSGTGEGARPITGGKRLTDGALANGFFVAPTVFDSVRDEMRIATEEIFGPVVTAVPFDDVDEVARRANATEFGLGAGVWTTNVRTAHRMAQAVKAGSIWVNGYQAMDPAVPFGGMKRSGFGRESGREQLDEYLDVKAVWINLT
jgi:aldehyde dehydrogenase (NAD+)